MRRQPSSLKHSFFNSLSNPALTCCLLVLGACTGKNVHTEVSNDPRVLVRQWTLSTHGDFEAGDHGFEYSNPILVDNSLVVGTRQKGITSLYPSLLQSHWTLPIQGGVVSELAVDRGVIFFGGGDGFLYSVNADNGRVNWRYDLHNPVISRPTIEAGKVYVTTSDDIVYAFDGATGKWLWHYRRRSAPSASILGASSPLVDGGEVLTGLSDGFLVALSVNDGQLKWEKKLHQGRKFTDVDAHPILDHGVLYVPSYDGALYALKRQGGEVLWRFDAGGSKQVVIEGDRLFLPSSDGTVYVMQKSNAKVLWKFNLDSGSPTHLVVTDRHVIFGSSYQYFYALDKNTGKALYRYNVGYNSGFSGRPAYDPTAQRVYVLSGGGNLMAFSIRQPSLKERPHGAIDQYTF